MEQIIRKAIVGLALLLVGAGFGYWWHMMAGG